MATYTTNLNLKKPATSDKVRIADFNNNFDTIDDAIGEVGSTSLKDMIDDVQGAVAIVANGDTHVAITSGQYVFVKNNTHGLSDGLYVASANVSANGTISDSNMTADSTGGLNALNSNLKQFMRVVISANTDLDDLTDPGFYDCASSSICATLVNSPITSSGFSMIVTQKGAYTIQTISNGATLYTRGSTSSGWGNWYRFSGTVIS